MKRLLVITSLIFCLFGFTLTLVLESYTYTGFWQKNIFISFAIIGYLSLGLSSLIALFAVKKYKSEAAKVIFSLTLLIIYLLLRIVMIINKELTAISDGNLEILYGRYHFDISVINQAQKIILPFLVIIAILFLKDILSLSKIILIIGRFVLRWAGFVFMNLWRYFKISKHRSKVRNLFQFWDIALFVVSLYFFWHYQSIFSNKLPNFQFLIRIISGYAVLGMLIKQKKKITAALIGSILIWIMISFFHFLDLFKFSWTLLLSSLTLVAIIGLYLLRLKRVKHD